MRPIFVMPAFVVTRRRKKKNGHWESAEKGHCRPPLPGGLRAACAGLTREQDDWRVSLAPRCIPASCSTNRARYLHIVATYKAAASDACEFRGKHLAVKNQVSHISQTRTATRAFHASIRLLSFRLFLYLDRCSTFCFRFPGAFPVFLLDLAWNKQSRRWCNALGAT